MVIDLKEKKYEKEGMVTVKTLIKMLQDDSDSIKSIVVSTLNSKGELSTYTAMDDSTLKLLGMLEGSKQMLLSSIYE